MDDFICSLYSYAKFHHLLYSWVTLTFLVRVRPDYIVMLHLHAGQLPLFLI